MSNGVIHGQKYPCIKRNIFPSMHVFLSMHIHRLSSMNAIHVVSHSLYPISCKRADARVVHSLHSPCLLIIIAVPHRTSDVHQNALEFEMLPGLPPRARVFTSDSDSLYLATLFPWTGECCVKCLGRTSQNRYLRNTITFEQ